MKCGVKLISCFFLNVARAMWGVSVRTYAYDKCNIDRVQGQYRAEYLPSHLRRSGRYSPVLPLYSVNITYLWTALGERGLVSGMNAITWHVIKYIILYNVHDCRGLY